MEKRALVWWNKIFTENPIGLDESRDAYANRLIATYPDVNDFKKKTILNNFTIFKSKTIETDIKGDIEKDKEVRRLKATQKEIEAKYQNALIESEQIRKSKAFFESIDKDVKEYKIKPLVTKSLFLPCIVISDWHIEERVLGKQINGLNEYNPTIAQQRMENVFATAVNHLKNQNIYEFDEIYLLLNGDIISGFIHEDLVESNYMSPTEASLLAKKILQSGIKLIRESFPNRKLIIRCNYGNHGRTTKKMRHATSAANSYEWLLYKNMEDKYESEPMIDFRVSDGLIAYDYFDYKGSQFVLRTWHGDNAKYQGGIGGLTIPLNKLIMRLDQSIKADYNVIGHFHTLFDINNRCFCNGSVIGYNTYAADLGLPFEPPKQGLLWFDLKRKERVAAKVLFCE